MPLLEIILLLIGATIGVVSAIRLSMRNEKVGSAGKNAADKLKSGKINIQEVAAGLDTIIRSKTVADANDLTGFISKADAISSLPSKYIFHKMETGILNDILFITDGIVRETTYLNGKVSHIDTNYNCWLYVVASPAECKADFYGQFPHNKEHQYLLEDLADYIFANAMKMPASQVINRV